MEGINEESDITYRATNGYLPLHDGEIELVGGDIITNVKDLCNGWTLGRNASRDSVGIFPTDFIVPQVDLIPPPEENVNLSRRSSRKSLDRQCALIEELQKIHKDLTDANNQQKFSRENTDKKKSPDGNQHMYEKIVRRPQKAVPGKKGPDLLNAAEESSDESYMTGSLPSPGRKGHMSQKPRMFVRPNPSKNIFANPNSQETQAKQIEGRESPTCQVSGSNTPPLVHRVNGTPTRVIPRHGTPPLQLVGNPTNLDPRADQHQAGPSQTPVIQGPLEAASPTDANQISSSMESTERDNIVNETANNSPRVPPGNPGNKHQKFNDMKRAYYQDYRTLECPSISDSPPHGLKFKPILKGKNGTHSRANEIYYREEPDQQKSLRLIISFLAAIFIGCILFLWLHFALSYTVMITTFICVTATVILILVFSTSRLCRCVGGLMVPSVCTTRGRLAFLIIITGFLLDGPITNIYLNIEEVSRSMSCSAEQSYNQSMLLLQPFDTMMQNLNNTVARLQSAATDVSIGMAPLSNGLHKLEVGYYEGRTELLGTYVTCQAMVVRAFNDCASGIDEAQTQCVSMVNTLGDVYHIARGVLDQLNPELWAPKHVSLQKRQAFVAEGTLSSIIPDEKRDVCEPLNSMSVCASLNNSDNLCQPAGWAGDAIYEAVNATQSAMRRLQRTLRFHVHPEPYYKARFNATRTVYMVRKKVQEEFERRTAYFEFVISIMKKVLPGAVLLLVYVAYVHVKNYVSKDTYDNIYVTPQFKSLDQKRSEVAGESLLPLKKYERNYLIDMTLSELSPPEEGLYPIGMLVFFLHILVTFCCYFFDYILYWILAMIRRHGDPPLDFTGKDSLEYVIKGEGVIADLLYVFLKGFHPAKLFGYTLDTHACLPRPTPPSIFILLVVFLFYFALILTVLLKAYILRFRNRVTAYFYPDREKARIVHLYNVVLNHRYRMPKLLQQRVKINFREKSMREQISVCHKMAAKVAPCRVFVYKRAQCLVCGNVEDQTFRDCQTDRCQGAYCAECYEDLGHICPLCHQASEYSDDEDYEDLEDDLQPYTRSSKIYV